MLADEAVGEAEAGDAGKDVDEDVGEATVRERACGDAVSVGGMASGLERRGGEGGITREIFAREKLWWAKGEVTKEPRARARQQVEKGEG